MVLRNNTYREFTDPLLQYSNRMKVLNVDDEEETARAGSGAKRNGFPFCPMFASSLRSARYDSPARNSRREQNGMAFRFAPMFASSLRSARIRMKFALIPRGALMHARGIEEQYVS